MNFYDPNVIIVPPNKLAPDGMVGVSELVDKFFPTVRKASVYVFQVIGLLNCSLMCRVELKSSILFQM